MSPTITLTFCLKVHSKMGHKQSCSKHSGEGFGKLMKQELRFSEEVTEICRNKRDRNYSKSKFENMHKQDTNQKILLAHIPDQRFQQGYVHNQFKSIIKKENNAIRNGLGLNTKEYILEINNHEEEVNIYSHQGNAN